MQLEDVEDLYNKKCEEIEELIECGLKEETQKLKEVSANLAAGKLGEFRNNF